MIRALAVLLICASPAVATQDQWPALFRVIDVMPGDILNIRAEPDADSEVIGYLNPDTTGIEVVRPNDRETWGLVNHEEQAGWVSLRYLQREPGQWLGATIEAASCGGTEPFWDFDFDAEGSAQFSYPGAEDVVSLSGDITSRLRAMERDTQGLTFRLADGAEGTGILLLQSCNDGMSGYEYGIRFFLTTRTEHGTELYSGCCSLVAR